MDQVNEQKNIVNYLEKENNEETLKKYIISLHPYDVANIFRELSAEARNKIYKTLSNEQLADIFAYMKDEVAADFLEEMNANRSSSILNEMDVDDAVDIVKELEEPEKIVPLLDQETKEDIKHLTQYNENTAGALMTTNYITLDPEMDVKDAMKKVVCEATDSEIIDPLFVCKQDEFVGTIDLKDLIVARTPCLINDIMDTNLISCQVNDDIDEINKVINNYDIYALPILDGKQLEGIVTIDDAFEAIENSVKEDYKQMAAINGVERGDSIFKLFEKRIPWLLLLLVLSLLVSNILNLFDEVISQLLVLAFFQTMLLDMSGNIGTQSLAVTIQKMNKDELDTFSQEKKHLFRELRIAFINSLILAIIAFGICYLYLGLTYHGDYSLLKLALVISLSLFCTLIISGIVASILPLILRRLKIDPAVASGPFITTLNDVVSIIIYFNMAILILGLVN